MVGSSVVNLLGTTSKFSSVNAWFILFSLTNMSCDLLSVHVVHHERGFHCHVAFLASNSPVRSLRFTSSGEVLAVGYQNGQV